MMAMLLRLVTPLFLMAIFVVRVAGNLYGEEASFYHKNPPTYHKNPSTYHKNPSTYHKNLEVYHVNHHMSDAVSDFISPEITCSAGFTLYNMECRKFTKYPPKFYCPSGFEENHRNECVRKITVPPVPYCDAGYEHFNGKCSKVTEERIEYDCPASYRLSGRKCVESIVVNPGVTCRDDSTMIGESCKKQIEIDAIKSCPEKHFLDPESFQCTKLETQTPYPVCPQGTFPLDGACVKILKVHPLKECPNGFKLNDTKCVNQDVIGVSTSCEGGNCVLVGNKTHGEEEECESVEKIEPVELSCDDGMTMDPDTGDCILRKKPKPVCTGKGMFNPATNRCEYIESVLPQFWCPEGYEQEKDVCVKTTEKAMKVSCPEGYRVDKGMCVRKLFVDPHPECPEGFSLMVENCVRQIYAKSILKCPEGYKLYLDRCIIHKSSLPDFYCPDGFLLKGDKCTKERNIDATVRCPYEFEPKGNKCVRVVEASAKRRCPNGYNYNPRSGFCEDVNMVLPEIVCADQFQYNKENPGMCVRLETRPVIHRCPAGRIFDTFHKNCGRVHSTSKYRKGFKMSSSKQHKFKQDKGLFSRKHNYKTFGKEPKIYKEKHEEPKIYKKHEEILLGLIPSQRYAKKSPHH